MGMVIADGYPYAEGLPDTPPFADTPPYHQWHMKVKSGVSSGYPCMLQVPALFRTADIQPPYPDYVMRCLGEDFNNGYPLIMQLEGIHRELFSSLYFADKKVEEMTFGGKYVIEGFCNGQRVYGTVYAYNS